MSGTAGAAAGPSGWIILDKPLALGSTQAVAAVKGELLALRKDAFGRKAQEYGLPTPKGLLIVGVPGTGKSLAAKATASHISGPIRS